MSTWEERMAAKAAERERVRWEAEREREEAERAEYYRQLEAENAALKAAGPENGCRDCYYWSDSLPWPPGGGWWHGESRQPGPPPPDDGYSTDPRQENWCYHPCHGDDVPVYCGPVVFG